MTLDELKQNFTPDSYWKIEYVGDKRCRIRRPIYFLWTASSSATQNPARPKDSFAFNQVKAVIYDDSSNSWMCHPGGFISFHPAFDKLSPASLDQFQVFWHLGNGDRSDSEYV